MGKKMVKKVKAAGSYIRFEITFEIQKTVNRGDLEKQMDIFQGWKRSEEEGHCQTGKKVLGSTGKVRVPLKVIHHSQFYTHQP